MNDMIEFLMVLWFALLLHYVVTAFGARESLITAMSRAKKLSENNPSQYCCVGIQRGKCGALLSFKLKSNSHESVIRKIGQTFVCIVGERTCSQTTYRYITDQFQKIGKKFGVKPGISMIASNLADNAHIHSMYSPSKFLFSEILILGLDSPDSSNENLLLKVDDSSNIIKCDALAIGFNANHLNMWLSTRGEFLLDKIESISHAKEDTRICWDTLRQCFIETVGVQCSHNLHIELCAITSNKLIGYRVAEFCLFRSIVLFYVL